MLPKRNDIIRLDTEVIAHPVRSSLYGGWRPAGSDITLAKGTALKFLRTYRDNVVGVVVTDPNPKVRKFVKTINPNVNNRQAYTVDAHACSFFCKQEDFKFEMLDEPEEAEIAKWEEEIRKYGNE